MDIDKYRRAIRNKVCGRCVDSKPGGQCGLRNPSQCGINEHMDLAIATVRSVQSDNVLDYITAVRGQICSHCHNQSSQGNCEFRNHADCGLDRFLELVAEAVEETDTV